MIAEQYLDRWTNLRVLVIGEAMLDSYLQGTTNRLCQEAPVPIVDLKSRQDVPGGAANTAANLSRLEANVFFLSVVGDDDEGNRLKQALQQQEISTQYLVTSSRRQTLLKQRIVSDAQLLLRCDRGSTEIIDRETEEQLIAKLHDLFPTCDAVIISDYGGGIITPQIITTLAQLQSSHPRTFTIDSKQLTRYKSIGTTAIKPNYQQAIQLLELPALQGNLRVEQIINSGEKLLDLVNTQLATITLDSEGTVVFERDKSPHFIPSHPVCNSQTTGAGDTFVSSLTLALAVGAEVKIAASIAAAAAAIVVRQSGTTTCSLAALRQSNSGNKKIVYGLNNLVSLIQEHRNLKQKIVFTNGYFNILHFSDITYLTQAKTLGDILIVGVSSDESIQQLKGVNHLVNCLSDRLAILAALESVNYVIPFTEPTPCDLIKIIRPDIYVKRGCTPEMLPEVHIEEIDGIHLCK